MAGNFINLYETLFVALADTERYRKHRFSACQYKLKKIAEGFLAGYSDGDHEIASEIRGEQMLQLLDTACSHHQMLGKKLPQESIIRYGNKEEIESRLFLFSQKLKELADAHMDELLRALNKKS